MPKETSPAFQLYVKDWRSSRAVMRMSFAERGMYLEMLLEQWESFSLPDDPAAVAELIGGTVEEWTAAWPVLRRKFADRRASPRENEPAGEYKRIINLKLEEVRRNLKSYRRGAKNGGEARAKSANRSSDGTFLPADHPAPPPAQEPAPPPADEPAVSSIAIASSSSSSIAIASSSAIQPPAPPMVPTRGVEHGRIFVHRWQQEALIATLGPHAHGFGLDEWIFNLSATADRQGLVLEKKTVWPWVQAQLGEEVRRRGLPIAEATIEPTLGKTSTRMLSALSQLDD